MRFQGQALKPFHLILWQMCLSPTHSSHQYLYFLLYNTSSRNRTLHLTSHHYSLKQLLLAVIVLPILISLWLTTAGDSSPSYKSTKTFGLSSCVASVSNPRQAHTTRGRASHSHHLGESIPSSTFFSPTNFARLRLKPSMKLGWPLVADCLCRRTPEKSRMSTRLGIQQVLAARGPATGRAGSVHKNITQQVCQKHTKA